MISWAPIWAVTLRHMRILWRDPNALLGSFYWPVLDILIWGFLGSWISQSTSFHNYEAVALLGIILWQIVGRGCNFMVIALSEELWARNMVNLFSLPLRIVEWMIGVILFYAIMTVLTFLLSMLVISILYDVSAWDIFSTYMIFLLPLFFSGIWVGFTCLQIVIMLGRRGTELAFVLAWFFLPFSGAYYPIEVLPTWAQKVSVFLPMSYVFQGMREYLMNKQDPILYLFKGYVLSIIYAIISVVLFVYCFNRSKREGLARLAD